jgi:hypothetical protein
MVGQCCPGDRDFCPQIDARNLVFDGRDPFKNIKSPRVDERFRDLEEPSLVHHSMIPEIARRNVTLRRGGSVPKTQPVWFSHPVLFRRDLGCFMNGHEKGLQMPCSDCLLIETFSHFGNQRLDVLYLTSDSDLLSHH